MKMKIEEASSDQAKLESIFDMGNMGLSDLSNAEKDEDEEAEMQEVTSCWISTMEPVETSEFYNDVHYGCQEFKELHHPADHEEPWPIVTKYKPGVGRFLLAARDIDQGELIFTEECFVQGPNHTLTNNTCLNSLKEVTDGTVCSKCGWPVCGKQDEEGDQHTIECATLTENKDKINMEAMREKDALYWPISTLRVLLKCKKNPNYWSIIKRMMSHREEQRKRQTWPLYHEHLVKFISETCGLGDTFTEEEIEHASGVIDVNSIRLLGNGHGIYLMTSIMSHSCIANTKTIMNEDLTVDVRAVMPIKKGQEITKSYVSSMETTQMRRKRLLAGWYFNCKCLRCTDPLEALSFTSSIACLRCREALILSSNPLDPEADWFCGDCGDVRKAESIRKLNEYFVNAIMEAGLDCSGLEDLLTKSTRMFHPNHYVPTLIRIKLNTAYLRLGARNEGEAETELLMRRKELLDEVHQLIEVIEPGLTQRRGLSLFERSICHLQLGRELYDKKKFRKEDFIQLLEAEISSLEDCLECIEHQSVGGYLDDIEFKATAARDDAESWLSQLHEGSL